MLFYLQEYQDSEISDKFFMIAALIAVYILCGILDQKPGEIMRLIFKNTIVFPFLIPKYFFLFRQTPGGFFSMDEGFHLGFHRKICQNL